MKSGVGWYIKEIIQVKNICKFFIPWCLHYTMKGNIFLARYVMAIILNDVGLGILTPLKHYITPTLLYQSIGGRPYLLALPADYVSTCHVPNGMTTRVVQYDMKYAKPMSVEMLDDLVHVLHNVQVTHTDINFIDMLRSLRGRIIRKDVTWYLERLERAKYAGTELADWAAMLPSDVIVRPMPYIHKMLGGDVIIQSAIYTGNVTDITIRHRERLESITNVKEQKKKTGIIVFAICLLLVVGGGGAYMVYEAENGGFEIPGLSGLTGGVAPVAGTSTEPALSTAGGVCSEQHIASNYYDGTAAAVAIAKGELPCNPNEITGVIGEIIRAQDPELIQWIIDNETEPAPPAGDAITSPIQIPSLESLTP